MADVLDDVEFSIIHQDLIDDLPNLDNYYAHYICQECGAAHTKKSITLDWCSECGSMAVIVVKIEWLH